MSKHAPTAVASVLAVGAAALFLLFPPSERRAREIALEPPFRHVGGFSYYADLPPWIPSDGPGAPEGSRAQLAEEGRPLGPAHTPLRRIEEAGRGAYRNWSDGLWFSSSDGSDPNTNGRRYAVTVLAPRPMLLYVIAGLVGYLALAVITSRGLSALRHRRVLATVVARSLQIAATLGGVELGSHILLQHRLFAAGETAESLFSKLLGEGGSAAIQRGNVYLYQRHHYLNYVLNPSAAESSGQPINEEFYIRRKEPIRSRDDVAWRALAIGGSTTYDYHIEREEETWVHRLEARIRERCGASHDVLNGGVGGYSLYENFIHYVTLLTYLKPNLVVLFVGINDVPPRFYKDLRPDYGNYRRPWNTDETVLPGLHTTLASLATYRLWFFVTRVSSGYRFNIGSLTRWPYPSPSEREQALEGNGPELYEEILRNFVRLLQAQGVQAVVLPQHFTNRGGKRDELFERALLEHNDANRRVAGELGVPFGEFVLDPDLFRPSDTEDSIHFNTEGAKKMADGTFEFLNAAGLLPCAARVEPESVPSR